MLSNLHTRKPNRRNQASYLFILKQCGLLLLINQQPTISPAACPTVLILEIAVSRSNHVCLEPVERLRVRVKKSVHGSTGLGTSGFLHVQLIFIG